MKLSDEQSLIAPCGMNCRLCMAYLREKNRCFGCRAVNTWKPVTREKCRIKNCATLRNNKWSFCFRCDAFPCDRIQHLDKRYRTKYHMSMIENLTNIKTLGMKAFLANERKRWTCPACGGTVCVHKGCCAACGKEYRGG